MSDPRTPQDILDDAMDYAGIDQRDIDEDRGNIKTPYEDMSTDEQYEYDNGRRP